MDEITVARALFGVTASVHYLFVAITLGLTPIIATVATYGAIARKQTPIVDLLAKIYIANYAFGIVSGLVMELQMSLLWTGAGTADYAPIAGLVALETVVAFFLESTLLGLWLAGRAVLPAWVQALIFWGITATAYFSAIFIVTANSYLHAPLGEGALAPDAFAQLLFRPAALLPILHIVATSLVVGAFLCAWLGALRYRRGEETLGRRLIRTGVWIAAACSPVMTISGFVQFSTARANAPTEPPAIAGVLIGVMVLSGLLITLLTWLVMVPLSATQLLFRTAWLRGLMVVCAFVPSLITIAGWVSREFERQPWFIVGRVRIEDAASLIGEPAMLLASIAFTVLPLAAIAAALVAFRRIAVWDARAVSA